MLAMTSCRLWLSVWYERWSNVDGRGREGYKGRVMRMLITGAGGLLGAYLLRELVTRDAIVAWGGPRGGERFGVPLRAIDLTDTDAVSDAFRTARPDVVLHAAALARVADCWRELKTAWNINVAGTATLARLSADVGARLVFVSTDLVFDGERAPYREDDSPCPVSVYGQTKRSAEESVLTAQRSAVVRIGLLYGPSLHGRPSFYDEQATALRSGRPVTLFRDEWRTPLHLTTAARALIAVTMSDFNGLLHIGGPERLSRLEMGWRLAAFLGADPSSIVATDRATAPASEPRPRDVSLDSSRWRAAFRGVPWPTFEEALRLDEANA
jgi:dTDP-4-dehydrorhamnose reductase